jgi:NADPH:quinone reductase
VLIIGASGGVGRIAVQLAARTGAHVIASVGSSARGAGLSELGAAEVVIGLEGVPGPVFGVLDSVGGPQLANALGLLRTSAHKQPLDRLGAHPSSSSRRAAPSASNGQRSLCHSLRPVRERDLPCCARLQLA